MPKLLIFIIGCASVALAACSIERLPGIYRIDVQQGNVVTQEMLEKLEPGMSKQQVGFVLGNPLIIDTFQPDSWHYIYTFKPGNGRREQRTITVWFENDKLSHVSGDVKVSLERKSQDEDEERTVSIPVPPRQKEESLLGSLMNMLGFGDSSPEDAPPKGGSQQRSKEKALPPPREHEGMGTPFPSQPFP